MAMHHQLIPLQGRSRALLRLRWEAGAGEWTLSPPLEAGRLYGAGPQGQVFPLALEDGARGRGALPCPPLGALVYDGEAFPMAGGFAGEAATLERAKTAIRLSALGAEREFPKGTPPPAEPVPPEEAPAPKQDAGGEEAPPPAAALHPAEDAAPAASPPPEEGVPPMEGAAGGGDASPPEAEVQARGNENIIKERPPAAPASQQGQPQSQALLEILSRAQALFGPGGGGAPAPEKEPPPAHPGPREIGNPFPRTFPRSRWQRVEYPGRPGYYLQGEGQGRGGPYRVFALPGAWSPVSPQPGFGRFLQGADGCGYWVRLQRLPGPPSR